MELIISPDVLFLDEPTTGLDATTAYTVVKLLKRLPCLSVCKLIFSMLLENVELTLSFEYTILRRESSVYQFWVRILCKLI